MLYNYYYTENWTFQHFRNFQNNVPTMFLEPKCVTWVDTIKILAFIIRQKKAKNWGHQELSDKIQTWFVITADFSKGGGF